LLGNFWTHSNDIQVTAAWTVGLPRCSELQLEAMAIECSPASQPRAPRAVVRALERVCEEAQNASGAGSG
jgi:hypothetical protein